jgi:hypothetical protein
MKSIDHLTSEEQQHYIQCHCGEYIDMRNLSAVFNHFHAPAIPEPNWTYCIKLGEPAAYSRQNKKIDLN